MSVKENKVVNESKQCDILKGPKPVCYFSGASNALWHRPKCLCVARRIVRIVAVIVTASQSLPLPLLQRCSSKADRRLAPTHRIWKHLWPIRGPNNNHDFASGFGVGGPAASEKLKSTPGSIWKKSTEFSTFELIWHSIIIQWKTHQNCYWQ